MDQKHDYITFSAFEFEELDEYDNYNLLFEAIWLMESLQRVVRYIMCFLDVDELQDEVSKFCHKDSRLHSCFWWYSDWSSQSWRVD